MSNNETSQQKCLWVNYTELLGKLAHFLLRDKLINANNTTIAGEGRQAGKE